MPWHIYVVVVTLGTIAMITWLFLVNRTPGSRDANGEPRTTGHVFDGIEEYDNPLPNWWLALFLVTALFGVGYVIFYPALGNFPGLNGWTSAQWLADRTDTSEARYAAVRSQLANLSADQMRASPAAQRTGRRLFINNCGACHQSDASGTFGFPNLADEEWQWGGDGAAILATIRQGRRAGMPPWQGALGDQGVRNVTNYVLSLSGSPHDADAARQGQTKFQQLCVACHGPAGTGNVLIGAPDLTNNIWLYGGSAGEIAFTISQGRNGRMPAFEGRLRESDIMVLARYVQSRSAAP